MKRIFYFAGMVLFFGSIGNCEAFDRGFVYSEAEQMLNLCINMNGDGMSKGIEQDKYDPEGWEIIFDSKVLKPYDNQWKLWRYKSKQNVYAIVIRGTVGKWDSIKQDFIASTVNAYNTMIALTDGSTKSEWDITEQKFVEKRLPQTGVRFKLAEVKGAEVHTGFTFGLSVLMFDKELGILNVLKQKVPSGSDLFITGHSQGAAIATLAHSFLFYAIKDKNFGMGDRYSLKSYVFAQPKPGNWQYAMDFAKNIGNKSVSYTINNTWDFVPQVPPSLQFVTEAIKPFATGKFISENILKALEGPRGAISGFSNNFFGDWHKVAKNFDTSYCVTEDEFITSRGNSLAFMPVGNVLAVESAKGDAALENEDLLREHHLGLYKILLSQLKFQ